MVIGSVVPDDFEKNATVNAFAIPFAVFIGDMPLNFKKSGSTINA